MDRNFECLPPPPPPELEEGEDGMSPGSDIPPPPMFEEDVPVVIPPPPEEDYVEETSDDLTSPSHASGSFHVQPLPRMSKEASQSPDRDRLLSLTTPLSPEFVAENPVSFADSLYNHFDVAAAQVENGIYSIKRVIALARKLVAMEDEHYKALNKALHHEMSKVDKIGSDGMGEFQAVFKSSKQLFEKLAIQHHLTSENISLNVLRPQTDFFESAEARLKNIYVDEKKCKEELAKAKSNVTKLERDCKKQYNTLVQVLSNEDTVQKKEKEDKGGFFSKMKLKISAAAIGDSKKLTEQLAVSSKQYQESIARGNARMQVFTEVDVVRFFTSLECLEEDRLRMLEDKIACLHSILHKTHETQQEISSSMVLCGAEYSPRRDIQIFLHKHLRKHGNPIPMAPFTYQLAATPEEIASGKLCSPTIFKNSLEACMQLQPKEYDDMDVPLILDVLIRSIIEQDGVRSEGIFRISYKRDELEKLRVRLEAGDYDLSALDSPHAAACMLKEWLRDLPSGLIENEQYADTMICAKETDVEKAKAAALVVFQKQPEINRKVILRITELCKEVQQPENSKVNRMTWDSLAIVFAPSFLRNPSDNEMEILTNSKYESRFVAYLFQALAK